MGKAKLIIFIIVISLIIGGLLLFILTPGEKISYHGNTGSGTYLTASYYVG